MKMLILVQLVQAKGKKGGKSKSNGVAPGHGADMNANGKAGDTGVGGRGGKEERRKEVAALETKVRNTRWRTCICRDLAHIDSAHVHVSMV